MMVSRLSVFARTRTLLQPDLATCSAGLNKVSLDEDLLMSLPLRVLRAYKDSQDCNSSVDHKLVGLC